MSKRCITVNEELDSNRTQLIFEIRGNPRLLSDCCITVNARFVFKLAYRGFAVPNVISFGRKLFFRPIYYDSS
jgi:hypothetical protein